MVASIHSFRFLATALLLVAASPAFAAEPASKYWAYRPVERPPVPVVQDRAWAKGPIDALILAKLEAKGLAPAKAAEPAVLIRRVTYDLTGLPPAPDEIDAFAAEYSAHPQQAYEKLIDRLLASPHYGEKWGRHWLDLVRYGETNGYERDGPKPFVWRYRDYVIKSFNEDKPFDQFVREQLAGDEMPGRTPEQIIATGYYRLGLWDDEPVDRLQARYDELDDYVATTAQVFLGMTMNCARCHDHKIDPIPQKDYYRLLSFFQDVQHFSNNRDVRSAANLTDISDPNARKNYEDALRRRDLRKVEIESTLRKIEDEAIAKMPAEDRQAAAANDRPAVINRKLKLYVLPEQAVVYGALKSEAAMLERMFEEKALGKQQLALSVNNCSINPPQSTVMLRGNPHVPGAKVEPGFPTVLAFPDPAIARPNKGARSSGRRTVLANWIASKENQLTSRVIVNRIWQHHFGRGIVASTNDFGKFGEKPTHPELLDWLASEFVEGQWRLKRLHKTILMSNTYQMSPAASKNGLSVDPANSLLWRFNMRRLLAEEVRDSMLSVSGQLNQKMFGPSIYPKIPADVLAGQSVPGQGWPVSTPEESARRSVYVHLKRSLLVPILTQHDQADLDSSCPVRYTTTVPTQALGMLNGEFSNEQAAAMAGRLQKEAPGSLPAQVRLAIRLTTGRNPTDAEVSKDVAFIQRHQKQHQLNELDALRRYCLLSLNTNEFLYLD